jgi:hypothetical protein
VKKTTIFVVFSLLFSSSAYATQYYADPVTTDMFLQGTNYTIPSQYFQTDSSNGDSYILTRCPYGALSCSNPINAGPMNWTISNLGWPDYPSKYDELNAGYPGFSEWTMPRGQCVAFAKVASNTENIGTSRWYAKGKVELSASYLISDNSYQHRGKMLAYFPNGEGSQYPQGGSTFGHVGFFLKFQYPAPPFNTSFSLPIGFWILDENFAGTGGSNNTDGKIRKHLILFNSGNGYKNGSNYFFVDVR